MASKARSWCFTYYGAGGVEGNPKELPKTSSIYENIPGVKYLVVGDEICPSTGRPHHQGYVMFYSGISFATAKRRLPEGSNIRVAKGNEVQNRGYCTKENTFCEIGKCPRQGARNDLDQVRKAVEDGKGMRQVVNIANTYQGMKMGEMLLKYHEKKRTWKPKVYWLWGPTGTGKSEKARAMAPEEETWLSGRTLKWWYEYDAHSHVIIDDFRSDYCTFHELLRILDRYPYTVETKHGFRQLLAKTIVITSCYPPERVYQTREDVGQLLRRIDEVWECVYDEALAALPRVPIRKVVSKETPSESCSSRDETASHRPADSPALSVTLDSVAVANYDNGSFDSTKKPLEELLFIDQKLNHKNNPNLNDSRSPTTSDQVDQKSEVILCSDFQIPEYKEMDDLMNEILSQFE